MMRKPFWFSKNFHLNWFLGSGSILLNKQMTWAMAKKNILIISANPRKLNKPLRLGKEYKTIKDISSSSKFKVKMNPSTSVDEIQKLILSQKPYVVHFSGHCDISKGLAFENDHGHSVHLKPEIFASLFEILKSNSNSVKCVVLNTCFSIEQAEKINEHVDFVIGTTNEIEDKNAILFSSGFYFGLFNNYSIADSFLCGLFRLQSQHNKKENFDYQLLINELDQAMEEKKIKTKNKIITQKISNYFDVKTNQLEDLTIKQAELEAALSSNYSLLADFIDENNSTLSQKVARNVLGIYGNSYLIEKFADELSTMLESLRVCIIVGDYDCIENPQDDLVMAKRFYKKAFEKIYSKVNKGEFDSASKIFFKQLIDYLTSRIRQ